MMIKIMNLLALNFLLVKIFPTLISQYVPLSNFTSYGSYWDLKMVECNEIAIYSQILTDDEYKNSIIASQNELRVISILITLCYVAIPICQFLNILWILLSQTQ